MRIWRNSITVLWAIIYPVTNDQAGQIVNEKEAVVCLSQRCRKPPPDLHSTCLCVMRSVLWWRNQESVITFKFESLRKRLAFIYWIYSGTPNTPALWRDSRIRDQLDCSSHSGPAQRRLHICRRWNHTRCLLVGERTSKLYCLVTLGSISVFMCFDVWTCWAEILYRSL